MLRRTWLFIAAFMSLFAINQYASAAIINTNNYDIYIGDLNNDGISDYYFNCKPLMLILHGDIATPILITPPNFEILGTTSSYLAAQSYSLSSVDLANKVASGALRLAQLNIDFFNWDNGVGQNFSLLRGATSSSPALSLASFSNIALPLVTNVYSPIDIPDISNRSVVLSMEDINNDGRLDIVLGSIIYPNGQVAYMADAGGIPSVNLKRELIPSVSRPTTVGTPADGNHVGSISGQFRVNESGAATYHISIPVADGVAGVKPSLSLDYNSQSGNGLLGKGWSLNGLNEITRCRQTVSQDGISKPITWTVDDRFCLGGQRLMLVAGSYYGEVSSRYKTEIDSSVTVTAVGGSAGNPDYFTVESKDGSITTYGDVGQDLSEISGRDATGAVVANKVLTWSIKRFKDNIGNPIVYIYEDSANYHHIKEIRYAYGSDKTDTANNAKIVFSYVNRNDVTSGYVSGYLFKNTQLLKNIKTYSDTVTQIRNYEIFYDTANEIAGSYSRVIAIQECKDSSNCYPATKFDWFQPLAQRTFGDYLGGFSRDLSVGTYGSISIVNYSFLDINANGTQDYVWAEFPAGKQHVDVRYALDNSARWRDSTGSTDNTRFLTEVHTADNSDGSTDFPKFQPFDYNADGHQDLLIYFPYEKKWNLYLSVLTSTGWELSTQPILMPFHDKDTKFGDVDSDGLIDAYEVSGNTLNVYRLQVDTTTSVTSNVRYKFPTTPASYAIVDPNVTVTSPCTGRVCPVSSSTTMEIKDIRMADFNGDGKADLLVIRENNCLPRCTSSYKASTYLWDDQSFQYSQTISTEKIKDIQIIDINGDGLADIALNGVSSGWRVQINTGAGFLVTSLGTDSDGSVTADASFADINHDGFPDFIWRYSRGGSYFVKQWNQQTQSFSAKQDLVTFDPNDSNDQYVKNADIFFMDANGDSWIDKVRFLVRDENGGFVTLNITGLTNPTGHIYNDLAIKPDVIEKITDGLGNILTVTSEPMSVSKYYVPISGTTADDFYTKKNAPFAGLNNPYQTDAPVLEPIGSLPLVVGLVSPTTDILYAYKNLRVQAKGRGLLGFASIVSVDKKNHIQTETTYRQDWPYLGMPIKTETRKETAPYSWQYVLGTHTILLSTAENTLDTKFFEYKSNKRYQPFINKTKELSFGLKNDGDLQGDLLQTVETDSDYDDFGNPISIATTTKGKAANGIDDTSVTTTTTNVYGASGVSDTFNIKGRLTRATVVTQRDTEPAQTRTTAYTYYDSGAIINMLKAEIVEPDNDSLRVTTTNYYDGFGNKKAIVVSAKGSYGTAENRTSYIAYDTNGRYVVKRWNDLDQTNTIISRDEDGQPKNITDINGINVEIFYTAMGTEYMRKDATGAWTRTETQFCVSNCSTINAKFYTTKRAAGGSSSTDYFDSLGRIKRTEKVGFNGEKITVVTRYDDQGRIESQTVPYVDINDSQYKTTNEYNFLGQLTKVTSPDGSIITNSYDGYKTTITNALGQIRIETRNGLGQLIRAQDQLGGIVDYAYNNKGDLLTAATKISASSTTAVTVKVCYDALGRKIAMLDPDKGGFKATVTDCALVTSSTPGWWTYQYDGFNEVIAQTDPKGQSTIMTYDALGRMTSRTDKKSAATFESYTRWKYDVDSDGVGSKGKLTNVMVNTDGAYPCSTASATCYLTFYEFDQYTRPTSTILYPNSTTGFTSKTEYDRFGRAYKNYDALDNIIINGGAAQRSGTRTEYNEYGYAEKTYDLQSGKLLSQIKNTSTRGQVTEEMRGNGLTSQNVYDIKTGLLLNQKTINALGLTNVQNNVYSWDVVGNLTYRQNLSAKLNTPTAANAAMNSKAQTESFCYDKLNRLVSSNYFIGGAGFCDSNTHPTNEQQTRYDGLGNIIYKTGVGNYTYGTNAGPHAVTNTGGADYIYDNNGNMTSGDGRNFEYTSYDMVSKITKGANVVEFQYGPDRARWQRKDSSSGVVTATTTYLGNVERIQTNTGSIEWKRNVAGIVHTYKTDSSNNLQASDKRYIYKDHLGSLDLITDANGEVDPQFSKVSHSMSFDAWGARRNSEQWDQAGFSFATASLMPTGFTQPITKRGFTGHEMLDDFGVVHMNGRIYDQRLGRFLQADPLIQATTNTQSYNRYSYAMNNPLNATDPSGFTSVFVQVRDMVRPIIGAIVTVAVFAVTGNIVLASTIGGAVGAAANGGNIATGAFGGAVMATGPWGAAIWGGAQEKMVGGNFGHGFIMAGFSAYVMPGFDGGGITGDIARVVFSGLMAGVQGGKFSSGAGSMAFLWAVQAGVNKIGAGGNRWQNLESKEDPGKIVSGPGRELFGGKIIVSKENVGKTISNVSDEELLKVESYYNTIFSDSEGAKMYSALNEQTPLKVILNERSVNSAQVIKITKKNPGWLWFNDETTYKGGMILTVDIRPGVDGSMRNYYPGASGNVQITPMHALLHESGHAVFGYLDVNTGPNSIIQYVDPILGRLEGAMRKRYENAF